MVSNPELASIDCAFVMCGSVRTLYMDHQSNVKHQYTAMFRTWQTLEVYLGWRYIEVAKTNVKRNNKEIETSQKLAVYRVAVYRGLTVCESSMTTQPVFAALVLRYARPSLARS